jgi:outer membrane protein assembly factor BamB
MSELLLPLGVIALPAIAPLIALIQLLFPGLLGEHWKQYRAAIGALLSQSTLMFAQWLAAMFWVPAEGSWWLGPQALAWGLAAIAAIGFFASLVMRPQTADARPAKIEFLALQGLALASVVWLAWQWFSGASVLDQMLVIAAACLGGIVHLLFRGAWAKSNRRPAFATESIFLLLMAAGGVALAQYVFAGFDRHGNLAQTSDASTFRCDQPRTGSHDSTDTGPARPVELSSAYVPEYRSGELLLESSPVISGGALLIGARHRVQASFLGILFGVPLHDDGSLSQVEAWRWGDNEARAIFSSPAVQSGYIYFGEGYHQHQNCRLLCLDARDGRLAWSFRTTSHVESPPTIVGERIYFGAGDDGLYCLNLPRQKGEPPTVAWHYKTIHVDASPLVVDGKVIVGGVVGDVLANLKVVALDEATGKKLWERPSELPFPAAASYADGGVFLGLGNGKLSGEAAQPRGMVWRLSASDRQKEWEFPLASSVLSSPIPADGRVHFVARSGECYGLDAASGERLWKHEIGEDVLSSPIVSGGRMFVVTSHGSVVCLDARSGQEIWRLDELRQATAEVYSSPMLANGRIYVAIGGKVHCVGDAT